MGTGVGWDGMQQRDGRRGVGERRRDECDGMLIEDRQKSQSYYGKLAVLCHVRLIVCDT